MRTNSGEFHEFDNSNALGEHALFPDRYVRPIPRMRQTRGIRRLQFPASELSKDHHTYPGTYGSLWERNRTGGQRPDKFTQQPQRSCRAAKVYSIWEAGPGSELPRRFSVLAHGFQWSFISSSACHLLLVYMGRSEKNESQSNLTHDGWRLSTLYLFCLLIRTLGNHESATKTLNCCNHARLPAKHSRHLDDDEAIFIASLCPVGYRGSRPPSELPRLCPQSANIPVPSYQHRMVTCRFAHLTARKRAWKTPLPKVFASGPGPSRPR
jgi:hypothetical protein